MRSRRLTVSLQKYNKGDFSTSFHKQPRNRLRHNFSIGAVARDAASLYPQGLTGQRHSFQSSLAASLTQTCQEFPSRVIGRALFGILLICITRYFGGSRQHTRNPGVLGISHPGHPYSYFISAIKKDSGKNQIKSGLENRVQTGCRIRIIALNGMLAGLSKHLPISR